ncbi:hypothetical protein GCM10023238_30070 [Streptomyces heliomycini]
MTVTTMRHAKPRRPTGSSSPRRWGACGARAWTAPCPGAGRAPAGAAAPVRLRTPAPLDRRSRRPHGPHHADDTPAPADTAPPRPAARLTTEHVPPRTAREREVTRLWEETLGIGGIGLHDNFFDLGGDSMRAVLLAGGCARPASSTSRRRSAAAPTVAGVLAADEPDGTGAGRPPPR